jgi:hypothetical protein
MNKKEYGTKRVRSTHKIFYLLHFFTRDYYFHFCYDIYLQKNLFINNILRYIQLIIL